MRGARLELDGKALSGDTFEELRGMLDTASGRVPAFQSGGGSGSAPPFQGGLVGYLSYDFARHLPVADRLTSKAPPHVTLAFGHYGTLLALDHHERRGFLISDDPPLAKQFKAALETVAPVRRTPSIAWQADLDLEVYLERVCRLKDYIAAGDLYQANFAQRFLAQKPQDFDALGYYLALRSANPAPFAAFVGFDERAILSTSPERLVAVDSNGRVEACPIKGTIRRHENEAEDQRAREALQNSEKDRAENIMIVDLLRNDLSRVCQPTSIVVPDLCGLESFQGLHHLVSTVSGQMQTGRDIWDVLKVCFPGGSITGAPKARAMEIIDELEGVPRGAFCGAIGYVGYDGASDFNIAIRTVDVVNDHLTLHVGGGITHMSDPYKEYEETLLKAERIFNVSAGKARFAS